jgi:hypothetical protein
MRYPRWLLTLGGLWLLLATDGLFAAITSGLGRFRELWRWAHFGPPEGLSSKGANQILQSKDGTVWVSTAQGVAWYDNYFWHVALRLAAEPAIRLSAKPDGRIAALHRGCLFNGGRQGFWPLALCRLGQRLKVFFKTPVTVTANQVTLPVGTGQGLEQPRLDTHRDCVQTAVRTVTPIPLREFGSRHGIQLFSQFGHPGGGSILVGPALGTFVRLIGFLHLPAPCAVLLYDASGLVACRRVTKAMGSVCRGRSRVATNVAMPSEPTGQVFAPL